VSAPQGHVNLSYNVVSVSDENGVVKIPGETDNKAAGAWGFDRVSRWRHRAGSSGQDLILGSDAGNLYLLLASPESARTGQFRSIGPLRDSQGTVIKIHNRVVAAGISLTGTGAEDLVLAGASYQMGIARDPHPGAGLFLVRNLGTEADGETPRLAAPVPLVVEGLPCAVQMNQNLQLEALDIDGDGITEVIIALPSDRFVGRICKPNATGDGLVYTGESLPRLGLQERIIDIDGDGELEYVFSGGETGLGYYAKLLRVDGDRCARHRTPV
jgi:hypothetical protein